MKLATDSSNVLLEDCTPSAIVGIVSSDCILLSAGWEIDVFNESNISEPSLTIVFICRLALSRLLMTLVKYKRIVSWFKVFTYSPTCWAISSDCSFSTDSFTL